VLAPDLVAFGKTLAVLPADIKGDRMSRLAAS